MLMLGRLTLAGLVASVSVAGVVMAGEVTTLGEVTVTGTREGEAVAETSAVS